MAKLLFYKNPVPLDKTKHKNLKLKKLDNLNFASTVNSVPVAGFEFFQCSRNHPVMFVKNAKDEFLPIALLSLLSEGHHLGEKWQDVYVPGFVRRYPFIMGDDGKGLVMIDEEAEQLQEEEGDNIFTEEGEPSEFLQKVMQFLNTMDKEYRATTEYCKALKEKGLLQPCKSTIKFTDTTLKLDHLYVVGDKEFHESLSDEETAEWFKKGWIAWTYAHIHSMGAMPEVVKRMPKKQPESEGEPA